MRKRWKDERNWAPMNATTRLLDQPTFYGEREDLDAHASDVGSGHFAHQRRKLIAIAIHLFDGQRSYSRGVVITIRYDGVSTDNRLIGGRYPEWRASDPREFAGSST